MITTIVGVALAATLSAAAGYFRSLRQEVRVNNRHLQSLMFSVWRTFWRVDQIEDFLHERHEYSPPRTMPEWPFKEDP